MHCWDSAYHAAMRRSRVLIDMPCRPRKSFAVKRRASGYNAAEQGRLASRYSLYNVLGVTPKATHGEIKAAYYRLSKTYHPDRNKDSEEAVRRFREIAEAYDVLGSLATRRRYDRGLLTVDDTGTVHDKGESCDKDDKEANEGFPRSGSAASQSRSYEATRKSPTVGFRSGIYNFDEWTQNHYGETLHRDFRMKKSAEIRMNNKDGRSPLSKRDVVSLFLMLAVFGWLVIKNIADVRSNEKRTITVERAETEGKNERF